MVSVIVPYNEDRGYLKLCQQSIHDQTYKDIQYLEIHSPDSVAKNINKGLKLAKGEFFKVVGEDDWLPKTSIEDLVNGMEGNSWICANAHNFSDDGFTNEIPPLEGLKFENMVNLNVIHNGTTMYRTEILREIGGMDESLWTGEEYEMHLRLMKNGYMPGYIDKFVYFYRVWGGSKSIRYRRKDPVKRKAEIERIQNMYR
jgi:glycosyltransferase involved in cell wall biosynthesis